MTRFLIKPDKDYEGQYEVWITYPWWDLLNLDVRLLVVDGTIDKCLNCIYRYAKDNYIYKYTVTVNRF